jgi:hypothetical protein
MLDSEFLSSASSTVSSILFTHYMWKHSHWLDQNSNSYFSHSYWIIVSHTFQILFQ